MSHVYKYQTVDPYGRYTWAQKSFKSQSELIGYLVENKDEILSQKKSIIKRAEGGLSAMLPIEEELKSYSNKAFKPVHDNDKEAGVLKRTIVANTYWWMDSHSDVHIGRGDQGEEGKAVFTNSIKNRANKVFPIDQHNWSLDGRMGKTLELFESPISWRQLGIGKTGMTEALFAVAEIQQKKNPARYEDYLNDEIDQHSVGMQYVDIKLAANDQDEFPNEYKEWQKFINKIGNRKVAEDQGYFFSVYEARLAEYSAVISGSNELTPTIQPSGDAGKSEASGEAKGQRMLEEINKTINILKH
jgi:hypothetical protein